MSNLAYCDDSFFRDVNYVILYHKVIQAKKNGISGSFPVKNFIFGFVHILRTSWRLCIRGLCTISYVELSNCLIRKSFLIHFFVEKSVRYIVYRTVYHINVFLSFEIWHLIIFVIMTNIWLFACESHGLSSWNSWSSIKTLSTANSRYNTHISWYKPVGILKFPRLDR